MHIFSDGQCIMPFDEEDTYTSASSGNLTVNATHIIDYPLTIPVIADKSDFECIDKRENRYFLK